jgi:hypothetical protein
MTKTGWAGNFTRLIDWVIVVLLVYWLAIAILHNAAFPYDPARDLTLAAQDCYEQRLRAVLIHGEIQCRPYQGAENEQRTTTRTGQHTR